MNILEIGAGSGRLSECIITNYPSSKYVICDIPPAIYIAYKRIKLGFPNKKVSLLIQNNEKESLNNEIKNNDVSLSQSLIVLKETKSFMKVYKS
jgi:putative sugar O-methyltransferase